MLATLLFLVASLALALLWAWRERRQRLEAAAERADCDARREAMQRSLDHLAEGVALLGRDGAVIYANPAAAALLEAPATAGLPAAAAAPQGVPLERFTPHAPIRQLVAETPDDDTVRRVLELERAGAADLVVQVTLAPAGEGRRLLVLQDLRSDAALERRRRNFVANASHELKTPIAALIGLLDLMEDLPETARPDLLARAQRNARGLADMAEDLLQLARAEDPDWRLRAEPLEAGDAIGEVVEQLRPRAEAKRLALRFTPPERPLELLADRGALQTVTRNLLSNAIHYTDTGEVEVTVRAESFGASLTVRDTGHGIAPEVLPQIFERFFRGDAAHTRSAGASGGTGLGLAIVRNLLGRMGGRISVQSRPGEGSTFRAEFPLRAAVPLAGAGVADPGPDGWR